MNKRSEHHHLPQEFLKNLEKIIENFISTEIEWVPLNNIDVKKDNKESVIDFLETLEEDDDVQNVYSNVNLGGI